MGERDAAEGTRAYRTTHDWERDTSLSRTIDQAIAAVRNGDSSDYDSLETTVDADALDRLVASLRRSASRDGEGRVEFTADGLRVEVTSGGAVTVRRPGDRGRGEISTDAEFESALVALIREAEANGVAVEGGWECLDESAYPEWGLEIYEVDSPGST